jgi:shikimate kinase
VNVFLIGCRGCGKTEVGRALAALLHRMWVDMDAELERRLGRCISDHVARSGWESFRTAERRLLQDLCLRHGLVVSTGGGVGADPENATAMRRSGHVVWLRAEAVTIAGRLAADPASAAQRPALGEPGTDALSEIRAVLRERTPAYAGAADFQVDTDRLTVERICRRIADRLAADLDSGRFASPLDKTKRFK